MTAVGRVSGQESADLLDVSAEVREALAAGGPVVALETTLVSHGFPGTRGLDVALESERRVRAAGAVPATVAVVDGRIRVGAGADVLGRLAGNPDARKAGPRDLATCLAAGALGSTTVGGTLAVCRLAGIRFMGTGGIGGVHRGFDQTLDISADLGQIARTPALVVASGPKSLLDVPATAELLETLGVPVLGWRTGTLPRFYTAAGGPAVSARVDSADEAVRIARLHWRLSGGGLFVAQPPRRNLDVDELIGRALDEAARAGATGQAVTPAVLGYLHGETGGATLEVNADLIADNAGLAAELAVAYSA
ncbi:MAG TPA: pseudouridine-5'-phosphate glycosidase [Streptosporangiaceae bacterium]|nr:pseudouridine-5'-phosphate glycosidase [Streptosporangiaceae bacterium]